MNDGYVCVKNIGLQFIARCKGHIEMVVTLSHFLKEILGNVFLCFLGENKMN